MIHVAFEQLKYTTGAGANIEEVFHALLRQ